MPLIPVLSCVELYRIDIEHMLRRVFTPVCTYSYDEILDAYARIGPELSLSNGELNHATTIKRFKNGRPGRLSFSSKVL